MKPLNTNEFFFHWVMNHTSGTTTLRQHECLMLMEAYLKHRVKVARKEIIEDLHTKLRSDGVYESKIYNNGISVSAKIVYNALKEIEG